MKVANYKWTRETKQGPGERALGEWGAVWNGEVRGSLTGKLKSGGECSRQRKLQCKGPEAAVGLPSSRNSQEPVLAVRGGSRGEARVSRRGLASQCTSEETGFHWR